MDRTDTERPTDTATATATPTSKTIICSPIKTSSATYASVLGSTPQRPPLVATDINRTSSVGIQHAHTIISEAESIIAMAEAMLSVSSATSTQASIAISKERDSELAHWKSRVYELEALRSKDQQKMNEMEIVMKGMAIKLEEYSKGSLADDWMNRVLQLFSS